MGILPTKKQLHYDYGIKEEKKLNKQKKQEMQEMEKKRHEV